MSGAGMPLPNFPCMCKAIYSWGGETKRDLGFVEGDLIECLNAGDGQWWMGRLRRNRAVGLFPSNYVEVLDNYQRPGVLSRPASRAASPSMLGPEAGRRSRAASPAPSSRSRTSSPQPPQHRSRSPQPPQQRARSPQPPQQQREWSPQPPQNRSRSPQPPQHRSQSPLPPQHRSRSPQPPRHQSRSPQPPQHRASSPLPPQQEYYGNGGMDGGSSRSRTGRSPSPAPYHHESTSRGPSPNPYYRTASPNPYDRSASTGPYDRNASPHPYDQDPYNRGVSPAPYDRPRASSPAPPSHFRSTSPAPSTRQYQRAPSPNPYMDDHHDDNSVPPPAPPPHRVNHRASSPQPPMNDGRLTPAGSRVPTPNGQTPSPLRSAMEDVMESLQHMATERPRSPPAPWSPESFGELYANTTSAPSKRYVRAETSLGIGRNDFGDEDDENDIPYHPADRRSPVSSGHGGSMQDRVQRFQSPVQRGIPSDDDIMQPPSPARYGSYIERPRTSDPTSRNHMQISDLRSNAGSAPPGKMVRPRPLSRVGTLTSNSTSNNSSTTNSTNTTAKTSASIMSGISAGGFSATSAGSLARRKFKAMSVIETRGPSKLGGSYRSRPETPSGYHSSGSGSGSGSSPLMGRKRGKTWNATTTNSPLGGLIAPPKPKKENFFKKILNSAKTSAASVRSVAESPGSQFSQRSIPNGIIAISSGRGNSQTQGQDWMQVRRDVNRSNTLSRNERIDRQEKQQMMDQPVLRPVDALDEDVEGDEAADGGIVERPTNFETANLGLVDKAARFISSLPPFTTPESLASHHVCRPYRSDVQRLRAIFTWVSEKVAWEHPSGPIDGEYGHEEVDTRRVLSQKRGSPEEIAVVVQGMCEAVGIHCDIIRGFLRAPGEAIDIELCPRPNHFWNAVIADGEWRFMDCSLASPTHPRRFMYSYASATQAEVFYFLTKPSEFCWSHIPMEMGEQHMVPPVPMPILLSLPGACPPFFKNEIKMINFDTSLTRMENLEVVQIEFSVPPDVECVAEVEAHGFAIDQDGDVFETGEVTKKRALAQACWENGVKTYRVKAVLPGDEGAGVLKVYAGTRGLMHSITNNPHPLAFALPIFHDGENPPYEFLIRHPTPHAQRHDLYVTQPQCAKLAINNTFVFAVRQNPSDGSSTTPVVANGVMPAKAAKLGIQTPSGKILRLMKKADARGGSTDGMWETIIKCGERGPWRALVLADRSSRWCVYGEWVVV